LVLCPDHFQHVVENNELMGWRYTGYGPEAPLESQVFLPEEVIHSRFPNPYNFWRGAGPNHVARLAASTDYASAQFMKGLMLNNADTGVIAYTDQQPSPEQREAIMAAHCGIGNERRAQRIGP
jgi:phage portal protein BeeE